eukprot:COSAG05_NODE_1321_length_5191_cov_74.598586_2_plen_67_part_00
MARGVGYRCCWRVRGVQVNTILKTTLFALVKFEKHFTVSAELAAIAFKLFCAQVHLSVYPTLVCLF